MKRSERPRTALRGSGIDASLFAIDRATVAWHLCSPTAPLPSRSTWHRLSTALVFHNVAV
jgi:hypothetical protein